MNVRILASLVLLTSISTGCKSYEVFVKDPHEKEQSQNQTQPIYRQQSNFASITAPERAPASTIVCSAANEHRQGDKVITRKECTDMDGVVESQDHGAFAEW